MKSIWTLALWFSLFGSAAAQPALDAGKLERNAQRSRITAERQKLDADFKAAEAACYSKFLANACREKLRPPYSAAQADLRRQEILMNEVERKISAADQLLKTEEKLNLQQQQQEEQATKVQQDAATHAERAMQREVDQGNSAEQAESNKASTDAKMESNQSKAAEALTKRTQATANVDAARKRHEQAAKKRADRETPLREEGPPTGKSLPAYP